MGITQKQYAKRRGVSPQAVNKRVRGGRLSVLPDGTIDPEAADREWFATQAPPGPAHPTGPGSGTDGSDATSTPTPVRTAAPGQRVAAAGGGTYAQAKTADALYKAKLRQLDYEVRTGVYVRTEDVERRWFDLAASVRKRLMVVPDRLAAELAASTDTHTVRRRLDAEIRQALEELAEDARRSA